MTRQDKESLRFCDTQTQLASCAIAPCEDAAIISQHHSVALAKPKLHT